MTVNVDVQLSVMDDVPASIIQANSADANIERVPLSTEGAGEFFDARMVDISANGARLTSETRPPLLARVSLAFSFAGFNYVHATGLVMWRTSAPSTQGQQHSFGVLFESMPVEVRVGIERVITEQSF